MTNTHNINIFRVILRIILTLITLVHLVFVINFVVYHVVEPFPYSLYFAIYIVMYAQIPVTLILIASTIYRKLQKQEVWSYHKIEFLLWTVSVMALITLIYITTYSDTAF